MPGIGRNTLQLCMGLLSTSLLGLRGDTPWEHFPHVRTPLHLFVIECAVRRQMCIDRVCVCVCYMYYLTSSRGNNGEACCYTRARTIYSIARPSNVGLRPGSVALHDLCHMP